MNRFYATFIPGLQEVIAGIVRERLPDAVIHHLLDGAILFETSLGYDWLNFFCFNNIFAVIDCMEDSVSGKANISFEECTLETHIRAVVRGGLLPAAEEIVAHNSKKFHTFRIVISRENKPAAIDEKLRLMAEQYVAKLSRLKVDRANPDAEFWFLSRNEQQPESGCKFSLFLKRLTLHPSWEKSLHPGELPPPLAWVLCHLGNLKHSDTVLDPFCGYGSIPQAALKHFHVTTFYANDSDAKAAAHTSARFKNHQGNFILHKTDIRALSAALPEKSIDAIITDPPWGFYQNTPAAQLYETMFDVFKGLLKPNGRIVILGARTDELSQTAGENFVLQKTIPILLSGKKAAINLFTRT